MPWKRFYPECTLNKSPADGNGAKTEPVTSGNCVRSGKLFKWFFISFWTSLTFTNFLLYSYEINENFFLDWIRFNFLRKMYFLVKCQHEILSKNNSYEINFDEIIEKNILFIPRVVVRLELEAPFVRPENLSAFVLVFFFLPFQLRVLCYSRAVFVQLHSPIFNENVGQFQIFCNNSSQN